MPKPPLPYAQRTADFSVTRATSQVSVNDGPAAEPRPLTASEYLAAEVYPTLESGIEELLKLSFPIDSEGTERRGQFPGGEPLVNPKP